jgi:prenyltransferase beta subunit
MPRLFAVSLAVLLSALPALAQTVVTVCDDSFDGLPLGPYAGGGPWTVYQDPQTQVTIGEGPTGHALRLVDDLVNAQGAACRAMRGLPTVPGRARVKFRLMVCRGETGEARHDQGFMLLASGRPFFLFFLSSDQFCTRQGTQWVPLETPVKWEDGRWYSVELDVNLERQEVGVQVDGRPGGRVPFQGAITSWDGLQFTSQRYARGELWADDLTVAYEPPPELAVQPQAGLLARPWEEIQGRWWADQGSAATGGALQVQGERMSSMRSFVWMNFRTRWPQLRLAFTPQGNVRYSVYARLMSDVAQLQWLVRDATGPVTDSFDPGFLSGWFDDQRVEVVAVATGQGTLTAAAPVVEEQPLSQALYQPQAIWQYTKPGSGANNLPAPIALHCQGAALPAGAPNPVTWGVPLPKGAVFDPSALSLTDAAGAPLPLQTQVLSAWEDGSARWLLLDSRVMLPPSGATELRLEAGPAGQGASELARVDGDAIVVDGGTVRLRIPRGGANAQGEVPWADLQATKPCALKVEGLPGYLDGTWDFVARLSGEEVRASAGGYAAQLETNGPERATVLMAGTLVGAKGPLARYELRLTVYRGLRRIKLEPTFTLTCPESERQLEELTFALGGRVPAGAVTFGGETPVAATRAAGESAELFQDDLNHFSVAAGGKGSAIGKRAAGWALCDGMVLCVRRFWQQFAKRLEVSDAGLRVELWTPRGKARRFGQGAAKTHELLLCWGVPDAQAAAAQAAEFESPAALWPGGRWVVDTRAMGEFPLPGAHPDMDAIYDYALRRRMIERERGTASYDMVNFGDIGHINSEIDAHKAFFVQWARTGNREWVDFALDWAQHSQDMDVVHFGPPRELGIHHMHYADDHNVGRLSLTHTWIEGQLLRYYLTGDRRSLVAADMAGRAFCRSMYPTGQMFDAGQLSFGMGSRGYGRACWALCELNRVTHNPRHVEAMRRLLGYLAASMREDGAVPGSHDAAGVWNATDECPHMAAINAVGIARYTALTGDRSFVPALERIARWQISRGSAPDKLGIMYHTYPGGEVVHYVDATANMLEAWAATYDLTGNDLYRDVAESIYDNCVEQSERWRSDWTMGVANMLTYLGRRDRWQPTKVPAASSPDRAAAARWLRSCQNPDGGFGTVPGLLSDMDSTFRAVEALALLGEKPSNVDACARWVLSCHNADGGYSVEPPWHSNVAWTYMALAALKHLGVAPPEPAKTVAWLQAAENADGGNGASPVAGELAYHPAWPSSLDYTAYRVQALALLGASPMDPSKVIGYLKGMEVAGAGFKHSNGSALLVYTDAGLRALKALGAKPTDEEGCREWLEGCRRPDGGFSWPGGDRSTVRDTCHGVRALQILGAPKHPATERFLWSCQSAAGGFAHRPGMTPTVAATWQALTALLADG